MQENIGLTEVSFQKIVSGNNEILAVGEVEVDGNVLKILLNNSLVNKLKNKKLFNVDLQLGPSVFSPNNFKLNQFEMIKINAMTSCYVYFTKINSTSYSFFLATSESIDSMFKNVSLFTSSYLNIQFPDKKFVKLAKEINNFPTSRGTLEFNNSGNPQLVSFVKMPESKFAIVSQMSSKKAFQVTKHLIGQTMLFALFLLGLLVSVGVYFSASLTGPILKLTEMAEGITKRNFSQKFTITTTDEISILGNTFNHMSEEIESLLIAKEEMIKQLEVANIQLEDYGHTLELKVEQRTFELKQAHNFMGAMVNSLDQGLMVFNQELKCHDIHTIACEKLLGFDPNGKTLPEILDIQSEDDIEGLKNWSTILFSELLTFENAIELGPKEKITGSDVFDPNYKNIAISYYPMRNDEQTLQDIVVVATDKTKEIQFIETSKKKEAYVNMVVKILSHKTQFQYFIEEVYKILDQLPKCVVLKSTNIDSELAMKLLHTLNGGFGLYFLLHLQKMAISYESEIVQLKSQKVVTAHFLNQFLSNVAYFREEFDRTIKELDQNLRTSFANNESSKEIDISQIKILKDYIDSQDIKKSKDFFYEYFIKEPIINSFRPYNDLVQTISKTAGKKINGINFRNENVRIDPVQFREFFNVLVHLFRNCVDHGIEVESVRKKNGKSAEGNINVSFDVLTSLEKTALSITVQDDGAGINPEKIKAKLSSLHPKENFEALTVDELMRKIFEPFFSTRDEVSALSGRGVGMSAIVLKIMNLGLFSA